MLFHLVWFILYGVLGWETTFLLVEILQQPIRNFHFKVFRANTRYKMDHTMWKSMEKLCSKIMTEFVCIFVWGHLCLWKDVLWWTLTRERDPQLSKLLRMPMSVRKSFGHRTASSRPYVGEPKSPGGGPSEIFIAMGGFLGGGRLFGTFQGGAAPPGPPVPTYV